MSLHGVATVQGAPVEGLRRYGVPPGGAFDRESLALANALLGNPAEALGVELALAAVTLRALEDVPLAVVGAETTLVVDGERKRSGGVLSLRRGSTVEITAPTRGARIYMALPSGWKPEPRTISKGGFLVVPPGQSGIGVSFRLAENPSSLAVGPVRVVPGPQAGLFDLGLFESREFTVSRASDRVGLRLEGALPAHSHELPSEPACPGVVQVTPAGVPIVLGPDGPTIGGYPKIAVAASADLDRVGQWVPGQGVRFEVVSVEEARALAQERNRRLARKVAEVREGVKALGR